MRNKILIAINIFLFVVFEILSCASNNIKSTNVEEETTFCFNDFSFYYTIENANYIIYKNYNTEIKRINDKYFETDYIPVDNYRKKYIFGTNKNLNLIVEYFLLNNVSDYNQIYNKFLDNISSIYNFKKTRINDDDFMWVNGDQTVRCFSCKVQMDGQDGYTFWIMYSCHSDWSAYDYIYEPFRLHRTPVLFDDIGVHWGFEQQKDIFKKNYPNTIPDEYNSDCLREIIINEKDRVVYVDYIFKSNQLENISVNYEIKTVEEREKLFSFLKKSYIDVYGKGFWGSTYDSSIYHGYTYSNSHMFCDAMITLFYSKDHYIKNQIDGENHKVSIIFMKY